MADYRQAREAAAPQQVLDYAMVDAAASLASTIEGAQRSFDDPTANGDLSMAPISRWVCWLIGSQGLDMPPELPQTCSRLQQPAGRSPRLGTSDRGSRGLSSTTEPSARIIQGFTIERNRTER